MRYIKEINLFEIDCDLDFTGSHDNATLRIIPKQCPGGRGICKESRSYPNNDKDSICSNYVRMVSDTGEPGFFVDNKLYCRGPNSLKFIMEN